MAEIEHDVLNPKVPLATTLRKCVLMGSALQSAELRDWATMELVGYQSDDMVPPYRVVPAPLKADGILLTAMARVEGAPVLGSELAKIGREEYAEISKLAGSISEIEALVRSARRPFWLGGTLQHVKLAPAFADPLMVSIGIDNPGITMSEIYWEVRTARLIGVLEHVRMTIVRLVAEMRLAMDPGAAIPSPGQASQAVNVVLSGGGRHNVTITTATADGGAVATIMPPGESRWARLQTIWAIIGSFIAIVATYIAYRQWLG